MLAIVRTLHQAEKSVRAKGILARIASIVLKRGAKCSKLVPARSVVGCAHIASRKSYEPGQDQVSKGDACKDV
jgi:hypothetical protein